MNLTSMLTYMAVTAITPGPNNLMCLFLGATVRLRGAKNFLLGSMTGLFTKTIICGMLNVALAETVPKLVPYLKWIGAAYMLYLAYVMAREGFRDDEDEGERKNNGSTFMSGIFLQCLNIKSWVSALSIFSVYVIPYTVSLTAIFGASVAYLAFIIISSLIWCLFGQAIQNLYNKWKKPISILMGLSLVFCAVTALM